MSEAASFPRRFARSQRFTLGRPRSFKAAPDGSRVAFLRSDAGDDPVNRLLVLDLDGGGGDPPAYRERLVADPVALLGGGREDLPPAERARRERSRERAGGIVAYATDAALRTAAFALAGRLFTVDLAAGAPTVAGGEPRPSAPRELTVAGPVLDPRPDPTGRRAAYVAGGALHLVGVDDGGGGGQLAGEEDPRVTWGLAEFVAAEEMDRDRGYWWAPDGERLAVARVDTTPVRRWWLSDPTSPMLPPASLPYPAAGTPNAEVTLAVVDLDGGRVEVGWDRDAFPYLVTVVWDEDGPLTLLVQSRDQRVTRLLAADPDSGATRLLREDTDPAWLEIVPGVPAWLPGGRLVWTADDADTRRLLLDGEPVTPPGLQVREVLGRHGDGVLVAASQEPAETHVWSVPASGEPLRLSRGAGLHTAVAGGPVLVLTSAGMDDDTPRTVVLRGAERVATITSNVAPLGLVPTVSLHRTTDRELRSALLLPSGRPEPGGGPPAGGGSGGLKSEAPGPVVGGRLEPSGGPPAGDDLDGPLPVLLNPYGGPHAQRVVAARGAYAEAQWFADQGFAVVITDGRGTPGRGPRWERAIWRDVAGPVLQDQVDALHALAGADERLDLGRVGILGWSFGGWLAALAVLRRPDVFHAAVAGAPVTDWRLYDTHYAERYLGLPDADPDAYRGVNLLVDAARLERPLLLVHGLADDNVVVAHTLRLSAALLAAGRPHAVLPLGGVTHMTSHELVAENLLRLQLAFLRQALGVPEPKRD
ncbi:MAG TPA: prolyl oligopeptidase family serine peptidase [Actinomycetota bacterium]